MPQNYHKSLVSTSAVQNGVFFGLRVLLLTTHADILYIQTHT